MFLVDTTFLIDLHKEHSRGRPGPASAFMRAHAADPFFTSLINWAEFDTGFAVPRASGRFLSVFRALPFKHRMVDVASRLDRQMRAQGNRLGENDNWVAAHALYFGLTLIGRDTGFSRVPSLKFIRV